jgi:hypothetical protein
MLPIASFNISCPTLVRFGAGVSADLASLLPAGSRRVTLIRGGGGIPSKPIREQLKQLNLTITEVGCGAEPSVKSINDLLGDMEPKAADVVIACGGGAVIDTGKAIAFCMAHGLRLTDDFSEVSVDLLRQPCPIPLIVLPTTAGTGAEVTSNAVLDVPSRRAKISLRGRALFPHAALVDPSLMSGAPAPVVLNSGLDAITQIIEAYTSVAATAFSDALTAPNVERGLYALRDVVEQACPNAMINMAWISLASGLALVNSGLGAAHGLASVVGARYAAPHGALCGRFLIPVLRQNRANADAGSEVERRLDICCAAIASVFPPKDGKDDLSGLDDWLQSQRLPRLADFSATNDDFDGLADQALLASSSQKNAVALEKMHFIKILEDAL